MYLSQFLGFSGEAGSTFTTNENSRFELGIATEEMLHAAWQFGHGTIISMDGTFGLRIQELLLFDIMTIDHNGIGLPIGMFHFFSASWQSADIRTVRRQKEVVGNGSENASGSRSEKSRGNGSENASEKRIGKCFRERIRKCAFG